MTAAVLETKRESVTPPQDDWRAELGGLRDGKSEQYGPKAYKQLHLEISTSTHT
jgi:hypothetical protein